MSAISFSKADLLSLKQQYLSDYEAAKNKGLKLDLTRGKPSSAQLDLSNDMDNVLDGDFTLDGIDTRNYASIDSLDGLPSTKAFFAEMADVSADSVLVGGNASLTLMYQSVMFAHFFGLADNTAWSKQVERPIFICPVPGYDRHFSVCEHIGVDMVTVAMTPTGPDMDAVEALIKSNPDIRGMWCVPRFSNPSGEVYSDETVAGFVQHGRGHLLSPVVGGCAR